VPASEKSAGKTHIKTRENSPLLDGRPRNANGSAEMKSSKRGGLRSRREIILRRERGKTERRTPTKGLQSSGGDAVEESARGKSRDARLKGITSRDEGFKNDKGERVLQNQGETSYSESVKIGLKGKNSPRGRKGDA